MIIFEFIINFYKDYFNTAEVMRTPYQSIMFWVLTIAIAIIIIALISGIFYIKERLGDFINSLKKKDKDDKDVSENEKYDE